MTFDLWGIGLALENKKALDRNEDARETFIAFFSTEMPRWIDGRAALIDQLSKSSRQWNECFTLKFKIRTRPVPFLCGGASKLGLMKIKISLNVADVAKKTFPGTVCMMVTLNISHYLISKALKASTFYISCQSR